uniref:Pentatricopeptide repeat-containing protein n=1 Tax=Ananas comosus var. bracteatus TaxID=296719 RepID=A0A6V7P9R2_ANACO|nr:unnamed protein product [Ananas comosus var. bracteatus]
MTKQCSLVVARPAFFLLRGVYKSFDIIAPQRLRRDARRGPANETTMKLLPKPAPLLLLLPLAIPAPSVDRLATLIATHPPALPLRPVLLRVLPASVLSSCPPLLDSLLSRLLASHSPTPLALSLFRYALSLPSSSFCPSPPPSPPPSSSSPAPAASPPPSPSSASSPAPAPPSSAAPTSPSPSSSPSSPSPRPLPPLPPPLPPDSRTLNTLLLGFKESRNLHALDLFYHDMLLRGFRPDSVTYCIRIDAYCKKGRFSDALELFDEMAAKQNCSPTVETITTLIYGAGIVKNPSAARRLFDEMGERGLTPDRGAHNALMGAYARVRDLNSALAIMGEMEQKGLASTMCSVRTGGPIWFGAVGLFSREGELSSPHALDLLVTGLCCRGGVAEAYRCFMQVVERGRAPSERAFGVLEGFLTRAGEMEKVEELGQMMKSLEQPLGPSECEME